MWDIRNEKKICNIKWRGIEDDFGASVYSCKFSHYGPDFIIAGAIGLNELQLFEKDIVYSPTWTISGVTKGVIDADISPISDMISFANGENSLNLINVGKLI